MGFIWETPEEIDLALAKRMTAIRKRRNLSRQQLSEKSNVSFGSIKRFESTENVTDLDRFLFDAVPCIKKGAFVR